jgi:hypothetical protein
MRGQESGFSQVMNWESLGGRDLGLAHERKMGGSGVQKFMVQGSRVQGFRGAWLRVPEFMV